MAMRRLMTAAMLAANAGVDYSAAAVAPEQRHLPATILPRFALFVSLAPPNDGVQLRTDHPPHRRRSTEAGTMQPVDPFFDEIRPGFAPTRFGLRVWRDLALLAAEGLAIGVVASAMFALAVFAVVR
jgi:hypothetical protein